MKVDAEMFLKVWRYVCKLKVKHCKPNTWAQDKKARNEMLIHFSLRSPIDLLNTFILVTENNVQWSINTEVSHKTKGYMNRK